MKKLDVIIWERGPTLRVHQTAAVQLKEGYYGDVGFDFCLVFL